MAAHRRSTSRTAAGTAGSGSLLLVVGLAACGGAPVAAEPPPPSQKPPPERSEANPETERGSSSSATPGFSCPVTIPRPGFVPPSPWSAKPAAEGAVWYGTEDLWTVLDTGGAYHRRKSVWWSKSFRGGAREEKPDISVLWRRLDASAPPITAGSPGTNAHTEQDGDFMIAGVDPAQSGCWLVKAKYRGVELEYVYSAP